MVDAFRAGDLSPADALEGSLAAIAQSSLNAVCFIDEEQARRYAADQGLNVTGCIGILESLYRRGNLADLRGTYIQLLAQKFRIDIPTLQHSLAKFKLSPL